MGDPGEQRLEERKGEEELKEETNLAGGKEAFEGGSK